MKRYLILACALMVLLGGCSRPEPVWETVDDEVVQPVSAAEAPMEIVFDVPEEAELAALLENVDYARVRVQGETVQLDPGNTEYQMHLRRMQNPGQTYRTTQATYTSPGGLMQWCWSMILLNLLCNCCCGGWAFRFRM